MLEVVRCPYCYNKASLVTGREIYPHTKNLNHKFIWLCKKCDARVGCHGNTRKPLGTLANAELRRHRQSCHKAIDWVWKTGKLNRNEVYRRLAKRLQIQLKFCHIALFDVAMCMRVLDVAKSPSFFENKREGS